MAGPATIYGCIQINGVWCVEYATDMTHSKIWINSTADAWPLVYREIEYLLFHSYQNALLHNYQLHIHSHGVDEWQAMLPFG